MNRLTLTAALAASVLLAGCSGGGNGNGNATVPAAPAPAPPPDPITVMGNVSDGPVTGGFIAVFNAASIAAALTAADAAADRRAALVDAGPLATLTRTAAQGTAFSISVDGAAAGQTLFLVFDGNGASDAEFGDTPFNMESVAIGAAAGGSQRINLTPHTTAIAQQVRAAAPADAAAAQTAIDLAVSNVLGALNTGANGRALFAAGTNPITLDDVAVLNVASSAIGSLVRTAANVGGVPRGRVLAALAADTADGVVDGVVPGTFAADATLLEQVSAVNAVAASTRAPAGAAGPCSSAAVAMAQACGFDVLDDFLVAAAICADTSDADSQSECMVDVEASRMQAGGECSEQLDGRLSLCTELGDAAHEPAFDAAATARFVDPDDIGGSVAVNPFFPLVVGNRWTYADAEGEEEIVVVVTDRVKLINGIPCRVVNDVVTQDGALVEDTDDWFAQDVDGNVWYCGEIAENFESFDGDDPQEPELVDIDGSFKNGRDGDQGGMLLPMQPVVGTVIRQEVSYGNAEDVIRIADLGGSEMAPGGSCMGNCLVTTDFTPIEPGVEETKYYAPGIGLIVEIDPDGNRVVLQSFEPAEI